MAWDARAWRRGLRLTTALRAVALIALPAPAFAQLPPNTGPTGGQVSVGSASIAQTTTQTTVQQSSQRAAVNWQSFNVGSQHTVTFNQPSSSAVTLNRVVGPNPSEIAGKINANGQLIVTNQAGVVFTKGAQVNAAGITVSAIGMTDQNFAAGKMVFDQAARPGAQVVNNGTITVKDHGLAALVAPQVRNSGTIQAKLGTAAMAAGEAVTLDLYGDGLVSINVTKQVQTAPGGGRALITNTGTVAAQGGTVVLTASAVDGVVQTLVDAGGTISADGAGGAGGRVLIAGAGGDVRVIGAVTADATAPGATGGIVAVAGQRSTQVLPGARISASGPGGGGAVAVGVVPVSAAGITGLSGQSRAVAIAKGATISANATRNGKGGTVTLQAVRAASLAGQVQARGGSLGGDGGVVQTNAPAVSILGATVDTTAPLGKTGTWFVNPSSFTIDANAAASIQTNLPTTNLVVQTTAAPGTGTPGPGDIVVNAAIAAPGNANSLTLNAAHDVTLNAGVDVGSGTLMLIAGNAVTQSAGAIGAGALGVQAVSGVSLQGANAVGTLAIAAPGQSAAFAGQTGTTIGSVTDGITTLTGIAAGSLQLQLSGALSIAAPVTVAGGASLIAQSLSQTGAGVLSAATLTGAATAGGADLSTAANAIGTLGGFTATGHAFALSDPNAPGGVLTVAGPVAADTIALTAPAIVIPGALSATTGVALTATGPGAAGTIAEHGTGSIATALLTGSATGAATLDGPNAVGGLGAFSAGGAFTLIDPGAPLLSVTGPVSAPLVTLSAPAIALAPGGSIAARSQTSLTATGVGGAGTIAEDPSASVATALLTGSAAGAATLIGANAVAALGGFAAGGTGFILNDPGVALLSVTGPLTAPSVSLTAPAIDIPAPGAIAAATSATLVATGLGGAGTISEDGTGGIATALLAGSAAGPVTLDGVNAIAALGAFAAGGDFALNDGTTALQFTGAFAGGTHTLTLTAGAITQTAAGAITAGELTGTNSGAVDLGTATNAIASLGAFTPGGDFALNDGTTALQFTGAFSGAAHTLTLTAGPITQTSAGAITAGELTGTSSGAVDLGTATNTIASLGAFTPSGDFTLNNGTTPLQFAGVFSGGGNTLALTAGPITQTSAGAITAGELTGSSSGAVDLGTAVNAIASLGAFTPGGDFALNNGSTALQFTGAFSGGAHTLTLNAGAISQTSAGAITAGELTGSSSGTVDLGTAVNAIASLGPFAAGADVTLNNGTTPLQFAGAFSGGTHTLTLTAGAITQTAAGAITAGRLAGTSAGAVTLNLAANAIGTLGGFTAAGGFALTDATNLTVSGPLGAGGAVALDVTGAVAGQAALTLAGDIIALTGSSATTGVALTTHGAIGDIVQTAGTVATDGAIAIAASGGFTQQGAGSVLSAGGGITVAAAGAFAQQAGTISAFGDIALSGATFTQAGGLVGAYGTLRATATAGDLVQSGGALASAATPASGDAVSLIASGNATQTGGGVYGGAASVVAGGTNGFTAIFGAPAFAADPSHPAGYPGAITLVPGNAVPTNISLSGYDIAIGGLLAAGGVTLAAQHDITETGAGRIVAGTLTGQAGDAALLGAAANAIGAIVGGFTAGNTLVLTDSVPLTVASLLGATNAGSLASVTDTAADISDAARAITFASGGTIRAGSGTGADGLLTLTTTAGGILGSAGTVQAGTLAGSVFGQMRLDGASNLIGRIGTIGGDAGLLALGQTGGDSADLVLTDAIPLTIAGATLGATRTGAAAIITDTAADAGPGARAIEVDAGGAILAGSGGGADGTLSLIATAGGVGAASGVIDAGTLAASAATDLLLTGPGNRIGQIATVGSLTGLAATSGQVSLTDAIGLVQNGQVGAGGSVTLNVLSGALAQNGGVTAGTDATLTAAGGLTNLGTVLAGGAATLAATAGTLQQDGSVTAGGAATLTASGGALNQTGTVSGATTQLAATGALTQSGTVSATNGAAVLTAGSGLTNTTSGRVAASNGAALTATTGTLQQDGTVNAGAGAATLAALGGRLNQTGMVSGATTQLSAAAALTQSGTVTATNGAAVLTAGNGLTNTASGRVTASNGATLTATAGTLQQDGTVNAGAGAATLTASDGPLNQTGTVSGASAFLAASGDLTQRGTVTATDAAALLSAGGSLTNTATGIVSAANGAALSAFTGTLQQDGTLNSGAGVAGLLASLGALNQTGTVSGATVAATAGGTLTQSGTVTATEGAANLDAANGLANTGSGRVTAADGVMLTALGGTLQQNGVVDAGGGTASLTALAGGIDQSATVTGASVTLLAAGAVSQTGALTARGGSVAASAGTGLANTGTIAGPGGVTLATGSGTLQQDGAITGGAIALTASGGALNQTGTVSGATVSLGAAGFLTQSGAVAAAGGPAILSGDAGVLDTAGGRVSAASSAVLQSARGSVTLLGTLNAPNVQLVAANGLVTDQGILTGIGGDPAINPSKRLSISQFPTDPAAPGAWILGGSVVMTPAALIEAGGGTPAWLTVNLAGSGSVTFGSGGSPFNNPSLQLFLNLNTGTASGQLNVATLQVAYKGAGTRETVDLLGTVDALSGPSAASASFILPLPKNNYQVNGCPIQSVNCIRISTLSIPVVNPFKDLQLLSSQDTSDVDVSLPDVADRDY